MHLAEEDEFISKSAQADIKRALADKPNVTIYSYPRQNHAFARHNGRTTTPRRRRSQRAAQASFRASTCHESRRVIRRRAHVFELV